MSTTNSNLQNASDLGEDFIASNHNMDLSPLFDKTFAIAISSGPRDSVKGLNSMLHGPYTYTEMLERVGMMWIDYQHHAKAYVLDKDPNKRVQYLDANTIDYIEENFSNLIMESFLAGNLDDNFTCKASLIEDESDVPQKVKKESVEEEE